MSFDDEVRVLGNSVFKAFLSSGDLGAEPLLAGLFSANLEWRAMNARGNRLFALIPSSCKAHLRW